MALPSLCVPPFFFPPPPSPSRVPPEPSSSVSSRLPLRSLGHAAVVRPIAAGRQGKFHPSPPPAGEEPPEAPVDSSSPGVPIAAVPSQWDRVKDHHRQQPLFPPDAAGIADQSRGDGTCGDDPDFAIALKRGEFATQRMLEPGESLRPNVRSAAASSSSFDLDLDSLGKSGAMFVEPKFRMTLAKLLEESRVVPVSVHGDLGVAITGIQHDSREVTLGDLFVCCVGSKTDGHFYMSEADKRGAVAVVTSKGINIGEALGCKALVIVEDTNAVLPVLAASFYGNPSKGMSVVGITGTNGKTTTAHLIRRVYEAMRFKTGMLGTVGYYIHGNSQLEAPHTTPDAVMVQKLMARMVHNGTEAMVMEASSHGLALGRCDEIDFDVAVFTNLTRDHYDFHGSEEEYRKSKGKLFARMIDPECHRKVANIDDSNAPFFVAQGNPDVPVVTYAVENKNADVYPLKFELSLFGMQLLVNTPKGTLEISSGLLGRHNMYNILAAIAVGISTDAQLEDIVRGVEEVDAVPGRCEMVDEGQAFTVLVDYAHTPDALSRLLDTLRELGPRRIITVFGCGGDKDRGKRPMMTKIVTDRSDVAILTSDNPRTEDPLDILDDMLVGVGWTMQDYLRRTENDSYLPLPNGCKLLLHGIRRVAVQTAVAMGEEGDVVVIAGKGHETYQIEGDKKKFFDDMEECREALRVVRELHQAGLDKY
uniref:UDP-N-acetylmuramoyl-L-alanyl-D-glutamate--2,6-diaminopimelate ligase MurE homolog, chloroplastic n=1 Tax=Anthurium amnicola TaxID=1678845 RepID=A0A1D1YU96_9ARAE